MMDMPIFSKVQFDMGLFHGRVSARILLNVRQRELSYQAFGEKQGGFDDALDAPDRLLHLFDDGASAFVRLFYQRGG